MANTASSETFPNGLRWKSIPRDYTQTVTLVVFVKGGLFRETPSDNGIGALTARTWLKSGNLLETVEFIGGGISAEPASDYFEITLSVPTEVFPEILPALKKQLLTPVFTQETFDREKDLLLRELEATKDDPNTLAFQQFNKATYKDHPYAMNTDGTLESVSTLTLDNVKKYYTDLIVALDMIAVLAGNYDTKQLKEVQDIFKAVPKGKAFKMDCIGTDILKTERIEATDPRIQQAKLYMAYTAPSTASPDYLYGKIITDILGGGMSSPYFTALRKERGYAYSVGMMYPSRLCSSRMTGYIGLQEENINDAIKVMQELNSTITANISEEELEKAKNHMLGQLLLEAETNSRTAFYAAFYENLGLGFDYMTTYVNQIRAVRKEDLKRISRIFDKPYTVFVYKPETK